MRHLLHFQADRIELVLASHRVPAQVTGGTVTPRFVRYRLATPLGVRIRQVAGLAEEIALNLGAPSCRIYREEGALHIEVPRATGQPVGLLGLCQRLAGNGSSSRSLVPPATAVLGLDQDGIPLLLRLPSPDVAHVLIAGTTGSGKTALARAIACSLALFNSQRAVQLVLIDPKGRGFLPFAGLPHLLVPLVVRVDEAMDVLDRLVREMERRDQEQRSEPRLVVIMDELADLVQTGGEEMERLLTRLTQRGREAGIHLVACTQKPTAAVIGGLIKSNFPVRLVGSVASAEDAKVASGLPKTGAERLLGRGDFLLVAKGRVTRMQAAFVTDEELRDMVGRARHGSRPWLLSATGTDGGAERQAGLIARLKHLSRIK
ncbi:MAG: DNA translocase FtsK [Anaerolineae bacterium]